MNENTFATKILWLSDLHIWAKYRQMGGIFKFKNVLPEYFAAFFATIEKEEYIIDYILLSGDIAFSGEKDDYDYFTDLFFSNLDKSKHRTAKLLVVPGNHDICRNTSANLLDTIKNNGKETYRTRTDEYLIPSNSNAFLNNFSNYSAYFTSPRIKKYFCDSGFNTSYAEHKLFGHFIDKKNKIYFLLLNTSWFSLGSNFSDLLQKDFIDKVKNAKSDLNYFKRLILKKAKLSAIDLRDLEIKVKGLLETKDNIAEYGNQLIGEKLLLDLEILRELFHKYSDYTAITVMHHPPNWLNWQEKYDYDRKKQATKLFHAILASSNFLFTGHEHVLDTKAEEIIDKTTIHLKAGCFLDELKPNTDFLDLKQNRFSILEINSGKNNWLTETVFTYKPGTVNNEITHHWDKLDVKDPIKFKFKYAALPKNEIDLRFDIKKYFDNRKPELASCDLKKVQNLNYCIYESKSTLYLVSNNNNAIAELLNYEFLAEGLKKYDLANNKLTIYMLLKDTHCDPHLYSSLNPDKYDEIRNERIKIFDSFYLEFNIKFDVFRDSFFKKLESEKEITLKKLMNVNLIVEFLPYWFFESNCEE